MTDQRKKSPLNKHIKEIIKLKEEKTLKEIVLYLKENYFINTDLSSVSRAISKYKKELLIKTDIKKENEETQSSLFNSFYKTTYTIRNSSQTFQNKNIISKALNTYFKQRKNNE
jgi:hypothetical protein